MSRGFWRVLGTAVAGTLLVFALYYPYSSGGRQRYNMAVARGELNRVQGMLDSEMRFKDVEAYAATAQDGSVMLIGSVENEEDLFRLMKAVAAERLPIAVAWRVKVAPPHAGRPSTNAP